MSSGALVGGILAAARLGHASGVVSISLIVAGLILGTLNVRMVDRLGRWDHLRSQNCSASVRERRARAAYFCLGGWILIALFLGAEIGSVLLTVIGRRAWSETSHVSNLQVLL